MDEETDKAKAAQDAANTPPENATEGANQAQEAAEASAQAVEAMEKAKEAAEPGFLSEITEFFDSGAIGLLLEGGFFMWPLLILLILTVAVVIERWRSLHMLDTDSEVLRQKVTDHLTKDEIEDAMKLCEDEKGPVAAVLSNGLRKYLVLRKLNYDPNRTEEGVVKSMENYSVHVVAALEKHLPILATVASVAPMIGFLGTVQGMIVSFGDIVANIQEGGGMSIVEAAASGIQVALLTTCFGLIVGIPAYLAYNYFTGIINSFVLEVESAAAELIDLVTLQMTISTHEDTA